MPHLPSHSFSVAKSSPSTRGLTSLKGSRQQGVRQLKQNYVIDKDTKILGLGQYGKVFAAYNRHDKNFQVAIKVLDKEMMAYDLEQVVHEVASLNKLDHPNIVKYFETYNDSKYIYLVMEMVQGMQLFEKICSEKKTTFCEQKARHYMMQLLSAIKHCHAQNVVHRDLKPENILVTTQDTIRLIDFGLSKTSQALEKIQQVAGTPFYIAPEVIDHRPYGTKADMWSIGVVMYILLSGYMPFEGEDFDDIFAKIRAGRINFDYDEFKHVSEEGKDLIRKLIVVDSQARYSACDALAHPWFKMYDGRYVTPACEILEHSLVQRLKEYRGVSHLRRAAINILVKMSPETEIQPVAEHFKQLDRDGTGMINVDELTHFMKEKNQQLSTQEIKMILKEIDYAGNGKINYSEFLSATLDVQKMLTDSRLRSVFAVFDTDQSGYITADNIRYAFQKLGQEVPKQVIKELISRHDIRKDGVISFEEFKCIFFEKDETQI